MFTRKCVGLLVAHRDAIGKLGSELSAAIGVTLTAEHPSPQIMSENTNNVVHVDDAPIDSDVSGRPKAGGTALVVLCQAPDRN